jgi:hypothetical protein
MAAPPSGGVILVSLYHKAEDFASEETGRRGQPVVEAFKLQFIELFDGKDRYVSGGHLIRHLR